MDRNSKFLASLSLGVVVLGVFFLLSGTKQPIEISFQPNPTQFVQVTPEATSSVALGFEGQQALVTRVVDGDTIQIEGGQTIRLIGIDTPETVDSRRPVGCFGKEASNQAKSLLSGKVVILQKDVSETDKYHRLLRYIFLPLDNGQILFVNDYLVREGFAKALTYPPDVKYNEQLRQAEREAREQKRGLWKKC